MTLVIGASMVMECTRAPESRRRGPYGCEKPPEAVEKDNFLINDKFDSVVKSQ